MKVSINRERCVGVGMCEGLASRIFIVDRPGDGFVSFRQLGAAATCGECGGPKVDWDSMSIEVPPEYETAVLQAAETCPSEAIIVTP